MEVSKINYRASEVSFHKERGDTLVSRGEPKPGVLCPKHREIIASAPWEDLCEVWQFARQQGDGLAMVRCAFEAEPHIRMRSDAVARCENQIIFCSRNSDIRSSDEIQTLPSLLGLEYEPDEGLFRGSSPQAWFVMEPKEEDKG